MEQLFLKIIELSVSSTGLILVVAVLRLFLKKVPKRVTCMLWFLVGLRLMIPFHIETSFGLMPKTERIMEILSATAGNSSEDLLYRAENAVLYEDILISDTTAIGMLQQPEKTAQENTEAPAKSALTGLFAQNSGSTMTSSPKWIHTLSLIWLTGVTLMLLYLLVSYVRLRNRLKTATLLHGKVKYTAEIKQSEYVNSPFILGLIKPYIYIPYHLDENTLTYVLAHEETHLRHGDHWLKMSAYLLLCVYWFHPLVWLAYVLVCRDLEFACDERVISELDENKRRAYARALLHCGGKRHYFSTCPIGFGETSVKERIIRVKTFKKPSVLITLLCLGLCAFIAVCFITNPSSSSVSFENIQLVSASAMDLRTDAPISYELNGAEIEELTRRLENLQIGSELKAYDELSPIYSLTVKTQDSDLLILTGHEIAEDYAVVFYQKKYYRIDDSGFCGYLNNVCAGIQRAESERQDIANEDSTGYDSKEPAADASDQHENHSVNPESPADEIAAGPHTSEQSESTPVNTERPEAETDMIGKISFDQIASIKVLNGNNGQTMQFEGPDSNSAFMDLLNLYQQLDTSGDAVQNSRIGYNYCMRLYDENDTLLQTVTPYKDGFIIDRVFYACDMTEDHAPVDLMNYIDLLFYPGVPEVEKTREKLLFEILEELDSLPYRDETCDGIPEISIQDNETEYQINLSGKWVWKDDREATLSEKLVEKIQTWLIMK